MGRGRSDGRRSDAGEATCRGRRAALYVGRVRHHTRDAAQPADRRSLVVDQPEDSWSYVFLCGLIPASVAFVVRLFVNEPERSNRIAQNSATHRLGALFPPQFRTTTRTAVLM